MKLEVTVNSVESALLAQEAGADRVELCDNFQEGGTTPSKGVIVKARERLHIDLFVIIRPRGGDFLYSDLEYEVMKHDILFAKEAEMDGVVFGLLNADGTVDTRHTTELVILSRPMQVTFHRAFDMTVDPFAAMEDIISTGANRILTSGQAPSAVEGASVIASLVKQAGNRIIIMPGAGINEINISHLRMITGATEFHASLRTRKISEMIFKREGIQLGSTGIPEYEWNEASSARIAEVKRILSLKDLPDG